MVLFDGALGILALGVWIFCIIDVITTPDDQVRNLPRLLWLLIVVLLADIGSIVWLIAGRPWPGAAGLPKRDATIDGAPRRARPSNPDDDEEFLAGLRARAEEQRQRAREAAEPETPQDDPPAPSGS